MQEMTHTKASKILSVLAKLQSVRISAIDRACFIKEVRLAFNKGNGAFYFTFNAHLESIDIKY